MTGAKDVPTYAALPDEGSEEVAYYVADEDTFYRWEGTPDGWSGYYVRQPVGGV